MANTTCMSVSLLFSYFVRLHEGVWDGSRCDVASARVRVCVSAVELPLSHTLRRPLCSWRLPLHCLPTRSFIFFLFRFIFPSLRPSVFSPIREKKKALSPSLVRGLLLSSPCILVCSCYVECGSGVVRSAVAHQQVSQ